MKRISALIGGAVFGVALLAACGGGGGSGTSALPAGTPVTPSTLAPSQSFSSTDAVAIPTPAPGAVSVAVPLASDASGASANAAIPATANVPPDTTISATYSSSADASVPALARERSVQGSRGTREDKKTVVAYLRLQFSADVTVPQAPAFSFIVPGALPTAGVTYWLAFIDPSRSAAGWQLGFEGPATVTPGVTSNGKTGTQLAFASNGKPLTFLANQVYYFVVYGLSANAASPTPVPSTVPTNPPTEGKPAPVVAQPTNIQFSSVTSAPVPLSFSQQGFAGPFKLYGNCTGIVNTGGASPSWTITPAGEGRCVIVGLGDKGASAVVHVGVVTPYETPRPSPTPGPSHSPEPTHPPTTAPTTSPSHSPEPTHAPTTSPTTEPSHSPEPTHAPTTAPTNAPTNAPSRSPEPTHAPTTAPTASPSPTPTPGSNPH